MGKYMRKRSVGRTSPAVELGVRTRARTAAVASAAAAATAAAAAEAPAPKRPRKQATTARSEAEAVAAVRGNGNGNGNGGGAAPAGCFYLQLRSRRLFMPPAGDVRYPVPPPRPAATVGRSSGAFGEPVEVVAGISRCSSTASSVDVVVLAVPPAAMERSCGEADEAQAPREDCDVESAVSDSVSARRERRETTPSSRPPVVDLSDEEWSQQATDDDDPKRHRRTALATTTATTAVARRRARMMPPAGEIEEFFAASEKAHAERFAAKYNFDVARGVPLGAGRYEWTPVVTRG